MNQHSLFDPPLADPPTTPDVEQQVADLHRLIEDQGRQLHEQLETLARPAVEAVRAEQQRAGKISMDPADVATAARLAVGSPDTVSAARFLTNLSDDYGWTEAEALRTELLERVAAMPDLSWDTLRKVLRACNGEDETLEYDLQELVQPLLVPSREVPPLSSHGFLPGAEPGSPSDLGPIPAPRSGSGRWDESGGQNGMSSRSA